MSFTAGSVAVASIRWLIFTSCTSMNNARIDSPNGMTTVLWAVFARFQTLSLPKSVVKLPTMVEVSDAEPMIPK